MGIGVRIPFFGYNQHNIGVLNTQARGVKHLINFLRGVGGMRIYVSTMPKIDALTKRGRDLALTLRELEDAYGLSVFAFVAAFVFVAGALGFHSVVAGD